MRLLSYPQCQLVLFLLVTLLCVTNAKRGGGSRGGSRTSSRGSSSSRTGTRYTDRSRDRGSQNAPAPIPIAKPPPAPAPAPKPPAPPPKKPPAPKPSAPEEPTVVRQPAHNPNFRESSPNQGASQPGSNPNYPGQNVPSNRQPPPYSPGVAPPAYSPAGQPPPHAPAGAPPAYSPGAQPPPYAPAGQAPPYSPPGPGFRPGINPPAYPQQPGMRPAPYPQQPGVGSAPYPQQPGMRPAPYPQQPGVGSAPYPQQPGMRPAPYPQQPGMRPAPYPQQPGMGSAPYPRQPGMSYPQQPLGSNVWTPNSGRPAPAYMNYGGLPTGGNMYGKPHKQKGFLGSLMSFGGAKHNSKNKYYGSYPGSYGMGGGMRGAGGMGGGFLGKHGKSIAMYTILPYMAYKTSQSLFRPRMSFFPMFMPSPFHYHHYGYGYGHSHYYDVYNENYIGKCMRPITPIHGAVQCNSTHRETQCHINCTEGYQFPDNTTAKDNACWHVTGVWRPEKNFPGCKPVCNETCLNGGNCIQPGVCGCLPEYRGPHCEFHFLNCDVRKLAGSTKISWVCTHTKNETSCKIKCKTPAVFAVEPASEYKCTPNGVWTPDSIPECIIKDDVTEIAPTAEGTTAD